MTLPKKKWIWLGIVGLVIIAAGPWLYREIQIDKCLDAGGAWNYDAGTCKTADSKEAREKLTRLAADLHVWLDLMRRNQGQKNLSWNSAAIQTSGS